MRLLSNHKEKVKQSGKRDVSLEVCRLHENLSQQKKWLSMESGTRSFVENTTNILSKTFISLRYDKLFGEERKMNDLIRMAQFQFLNFNTLQREIRVKVHKRKLTVVCFHQKHASGGYNQIPDTPYQTVNGKFVLNAVW